MSKVMTITKFILEDKQFEIKLILPVLFNLDFDYGAELQNATLLVNESHLGAAPAEWHLGAVLTIRDEHCLKNGQGENFKLAIIRNKKKRFRYKL